jgi:CRISPR-associated exonuclease Cas4
VDGAGWEPADAPAGDDNFIQISALEHYSYCPRQCALIHVEQTFEENLFTIRGRLLHERADSGEITAAGGVRVVRDVPLWSERLGLTGKADVVEFRPEGPYPVEYKSGRRHGRHPDFQLCAQALCLEEMLGVTVKRGALYYAATRSRHEIALDARLREETERMVSNVRQMLAGAQLPAAPNDARCPNCSLIDACLPGGVGEPSRLRGLQGALYQPLTLEAD